MIPINQPNTPIIAPATAKTIPMKIRAIIQVIILSNIPSLYTHLKKKATMLYTILKVSYTKYNGKH